MKELIIGVMLFVLPLTCFASGDDPLSEIIDIMNQLESIQSKISGDTSILSSNSTQQIKNLESEWSALTKSYGMSDTEAEQNARLWSADDWDQVINQASGGNNERFQQLMTSYSSMYPNVNSSKNIKVKNLEATSYSQQGQTTNAALAASNYTYDEINDHIKNLETILHQVDDENKNQNEKAAIDLNSRLVAELGFIQIELLKLQSIHTQMDATKNQSELNDDTVDKLFINNQ